MSSFQIIVGSMLGGSEYVAEACEEQLLALGHEATVHLQPVLADISYENQIWLFWLRALLLGNQPLRLILHGMPQYNRKQRLEFFP